MFSLSRIFFINDNILLDLSMGSTPGVLQETGTIYMSRVSGSTPFHGDYRFSFLCCVFLFCVFSFCVFCLGIVYSVFSILFYIHSIIY